MFDTYILTIDRMSLLKLSCHQRGFFHMFQIIPPTHIRKAHLAATTLQSTVCPSTDPGTRTDKNEKPTDRSANGIQSIQIARGDCCCCCMLIRSQCEISSSRERPSAIFCIWNLELGRRKEGRTFQKNSTNKISPPDQRKFQIPRNHCGHASDTDPSIYDGGRILVALSGPPL